MDDTLTRAHDLAARGEPFALATVVRAERPTSARPGMKAIILADGTLEGWVGGSCAHPVVVREALRLLREETPGLIGLSPPGQPGPERPGVIYHPMSCHSGGSLEIYIEPVLPRPQLLLVGEAPLVSALEALGRLQGFTVAVASAGEKRPQAEAGARLSLEQLSRLRQGLCRDGSFPRFRKWLGHKLHHSSGNHRKATPGRPDCDQAGSCLQGRFGRHHRRAGFSDRAGDNEEMAISAFMGIFLSLLKGP